MNSKDFRNIREAKKLLKAAEKRKDNKESLELDLSGTVYPKDFPFRDIDNPRPNEAELRLNRVITDVEMMLDYFKQNARNASSGYRTPKEVASAARMSIKQLEKFTLPMEYSAGGIYG